MQDSTDGYRLHPLPDAEFVRRARTISTDELSKMVDDAAYGLESLRNAMQKHKEAFAGQDAQLSEWINLIHQMLVNMREIGHGVAAGPGT